jgi:hypothetical protein
MKQRRVFVGHDSGWTTDLACVSSWGSHLACRQKASLLNLPKQPADCLTATPRCFLPPQVKALQAEIAAAEHEAQQLEAQHQHLKRQQAALQVGGCSWFGAEPTALSGRCPKAFWITNPLVQKSAFAVLQQ